MKYIDVLKESLQEADVTKTSDILGPMVEPILGYDGDGDLVTHKNASDILKKYYFENDSEGIVTLDNNTETVTDGEPDQNKIDKIKKTVEEIIKSDDETNQPTEKTLKEMVTSLEDILIGDDVNLSESEEKSEITRKTENLLFEDVTVLNKLENLLEEELNNSEDDSADEASDDVLIDKDTKVKMESDNTEPEEEKSDNDDSSNNESDEETVLNVDKTIDNIEEMLQMDNLTNADLILNDIESMLGEQNEIVGIDSLDENNDKEVTTESLEDSILEWLIMEIEDKTEEDNTNDILNENDDSDNIENDILKEAFAIFEKEDENISNDNDESSELDDFKVQSIDSSKIRV